MQIVTAAIDTQLHEMQLPLHNLMMGEAAGEADFAVRLVDGEESDDLETSSGAERHDVDYETSEAEPHVEHGGSLGDGFKLSATQAEELKFSRKKKEEREATEKRAWVVSPGEFVRCLLSIR